MEFTSKELINEKLIREVQLCGYRKYQSAIQACSTKLPDQLTATEQKVLERFTKHHHEALTICWSNALLFGDQVRTLSVPENIALIKLVRRGLINVYRVYAHACGYRYLWEVATQSAKVSNTPTIPQ